mmetsp:Transcript_17303/g.49155  ORF Transcript_17303/g.49155 Transcript_17303/m.49155 type:complete len:744 (+) Transcript_17303:67-2298(+)
MVRALDARFVRETQAAYEFSMNNLMWKQASFFAERLVAESPGDESTYKLAVACFHNQDFWRARWHLQGNSLPEAHYLLAKACFHLRQWDEAEDALLGSPACLEVVNGPAGMFLLGQVKEQQFKSDQAVECYARCLELCPFMWEAYERWSWLVVGVPSPSRSSTATMAATTFLDERVAAATGAVPTSMGGDAGAFRLQHAPSRNEREPTSQPMARKDRRGEGLRPGAANGFNVDPKDMTLPLRRSLLGAEGAAVGSNVDPGGGNGEPEVSLAQLLQKVGLALHALHAFEGSQALQLLNHLPRRHHDTVYVLDLVGKCFFEAAEYKKAEEVFQKVWKMEPHRTEGLEIYSTALWHLRKDIALGSLAQHFLQGNRLKPEVWCVVGNCFSLQKEHDTAIKFFKRAIQVNPSFAYAYTLCGHEFVANEKFDKAVPMYEQALTIDPRHYNAWWGLGNIYHRQEEHENAKYHFVKALEINRNNSVLRCYLGMVLDALNNPLLALDNFHKAAQGEPPNGMAYFHKACVLMKLERYEEALSDLKKVRCLAPKEACVHFQLGQVYMKLQRDRKALLHFNIAMDLNRDSKDDHTIRTHIERLHIRGIRESDAPSPVQSGRRNQGQPAGGRAANSDRHNPAQFHQGDPQVHMQMLGAAMLAVSSSPPQNTRHHVGGSLAPMPQVSGSAATAAAPTAAVGRWSAGSRGSAPMHQAAQVRATPTGRPSTGGSPGTSGWQGAPGPPGPYAGAAPAFRY